MEEKHEGFGFVSTGHVVELDAIGVDVFVFSKGGVQHAIRRGRPLGALEKENRMEDEFD